MITDRSQFEHRERLLPVTHDRSADREVCRSSDQSAAAAEDRAKRERHQEFRRRDLCLGGEADDDRQEHRRGRRVLEHAGARCCRDHDQSCKHKLAVPGDPVHPAADHIDHSRLDETADQNKQAADRDNDVVPKTRNRVLNVQHPRQHKAHHQQNANDIDGQLLSSEQNDRYQEQNKSQRDWCHRSQRIADFAKFGKKKESFVVGVTANSGWRLRLFRREPQLTPGFATS